MNPIAASEIKRIIGNRHHEKHPFRNRRAGMEGFARMIPLVDELTAEELVGFLKPMLDELLSKQHECHSCFAKLLVFAEMFCVRRAPAEAAAYWKEYRARESRGRRDQPFRDYRLEVYEAIVRFGGRGGAGTGAIN